MKTSHEDGKKILIMYTDAGGGHLATARALRAILHRETAHKVTLLNPYRELGPDTDLFPLFTGYTAEEIYNRFVLGKNWPAPLCLFYYGLAWLNLNAGYPRTVARFLRYLRFNRPDLIVSVMPMANQGIYRGVRAYAGGSPLPLLVVATDFQEGVPRSWFPGEGDYFIVCGSGRCHGQALAKPHPPAFTFQTSGLPVHPAFYDPPPPDRAGERARLGLAPDLPTGCMMYGSAGSGRMEQLARALKHGGPKCQMIFLCGHNQALARALGRLNLPYPHLILGYTTQAPYYFALSDFLVCKPGPGAISEARVAGLSLLVDRRRVLPQERCNLSMVRRQRLGLCFRGPGDFRRALGELLASGLGRGEAGSPAPGRENRAIFELPGIIQDILRQTEQQPPGAAGRPNFAK